MEMERGTIVSYEGLPGSGLATLTVRNEETGLEDAIPCEAGATSRALNSAFDRPIAGEEIYYQIGEYGLLLWFCPVEEWSDENEVVDEEEDPTDWSD